MRIIRVSRVRELKGYKVKSGEGERECVVTVISTLHALRVIRGYKGYWS